MGTYPRSRKHDVTALNEEMEIARDGQTIGNFLVDTIWLLALGNFRVTPTRGGTIPARSRGVTQFIGNGN